MSIHRRAENARCAERSVYVQSRMLVLGATVELPTMASADHYMRSTPSSEEALQGLAAFDAVRWQAIVTVVRLWAFLLVSRQLGSALLFGVRVPAGVKTRIGWRPWHSE